MKRILIISCLMLSFTVHAFCQRAAVESAFDKYHINRIAIDSLTQHNELRFNFDLITTIVTESSQKIYKAHHDASKTGEEAWALQSVNNGNPSGSDRSTFKKQHDQHIPALKPDTSTFKLVKDDGKELVVSFQYDQTSMIDDNKFMKDCLVKLFFDATTGKLLRSEGSITNSFKIKMFKANYLASTVIYQYNEVIERYLPLKEEVSINLNILGSAVDMITTNEYSNYQQP
ncbi:hypothetical protein [Pinibacter aurantiacus]|uniref:Uncharacterized protein n=1 Tax=Pinibacter aurantiacus TaxID=2851599 RepID=A0A9E2S617_9BACT|nr:hypothetical protein [Pinibacter aurantiacus]MBV4355873.1 hypothetical protein [Pinibacter aurantiacus]